MVLIFQPSTSICCWELDNQIARYSRNSDDKPKLVIYAFFWARVSATYNRVESAHIAVDIAHYIDHAFFLKSQIKCFKTGLILHEYVVKDAAEGKIIRIAQTDFHRIGSNFFKDKQLIPNLNNSVAALVISQ